MRELRPDAGEEARPRLAQAALLLLADGRLPAGGHAHSGGIEAAAALENVRDVASLEGFLLGRAATAGAVAAAFAAAACGAAANPRFRTIGADGVTKLRELDTELDARIPSAALRAASRKLGRQLLRAGHAMWPDHDLDALSATLAPGLHQAVALGVVAAAAGLDEVCAAAAALHDAVASPATAAVRLLGLDPFAVHAALARLAPRLDAMVVDAAAEAHTLPAEMPAWSAPQLDILAERHATWEVRLFAS